MGQVGGAKVRLRVVATLGARCSDMRVFRGSVRGGDRQGTGVRSHGEVAGDSQERRLSIRFRVSARVWWARVS